MSDVRVSVIIPCYNYGRFIAETLRSVQQQDCEQWECIVVDDGSTDDSAQQVEAFLGDARIRYIHQHNHGLSAARNTGIAAARGALVLFLDADDRIAPDKLSQHLQFFAQHPDIDISYGDFFYFPSERPQELFPSFELNPNLRLPRVTARGEALLSQLVIGNIMPVNAAMVRKALLDRVGPFDTALRSLEDWDLWLRCACAGAAIHFLGGGQACAYIRVHATSMSKNRAAMYANELALRNKIANYLAGVPALSSRKLLDLNRRHSVRVLSALIGASGLLSAQLPQLLRRAGPGTFFKAYLRALKKSGRSRCAAAD